MSTPSIFSAIQKIKALLTLEQKIKWVVIIGFALCTSLLEVVTASVIVVFAQVLNNPGVGHKYLSKLGLHIALSPGRITLLIAIICGVVYLFKNLVAAAEVFYQNFSIQKMSYQFRNKLLYRYAETDYGFYLTRNSSFGSQVVSDAEQMFTSGMVPLASIISDGVTFLCLIVMLIMMNTFLAVIIFFIGTVLGLIIGKVLLPQFYSWGKQLQEAGLYTSQNLLQFFHAFKEMVLLGKREDLIDRYKLYSLKKSSTQAIQTATNALPRMVIEVLFIGLFVTAVAFLCLGREDNFKIIGILGGYLYVGFRLMPGLNRIINQLNNFKMVVPSIERVYEEYNMVAVKDSYLDIPEFIFKKNIKLKDVSFCYLNTKKNVLDHIDFEIKKGECIGIIGETGSGKSTLVDIILGLLKPQDGAILIDDKYPVNCYQWHKKIGYVPQSIYLMDNSIAANIAFGEKDENIDLAQLNKVIDQAQLRKFINQLPDDVKTVVGERGVRLSGGERQRIAIARALYRNPEVLIFDEATSALDNETEARLMETINKISKEHTVIMIAHRLTTLKNCDRVITLENGRILKIVDCALKVSHALL